MMDTKKTRTLKYGRPSQAPERARSNRVVTFVTDWELQGLLEIAEAEERSLSAVVHRIIAKHLRNAKSGQAEN